MNDFDKIEKAMLFMIAAMFAVLSVYWIVSGIAGVIK